MLRSGVPGSGDIGPGPICYGGARHCWLPGVTTSNPLPNTFLLGHWRVLRDQNRIERLDGGGGAIVARLEPKAMDVLCLLARRAGQTVSRDELLDQAWQGRVVVEGTLSRIILSLRQALGDDARAPKFIETVPKRGYRLLVTPVSEDDAPARQAVTTPAPPDFSAHAEVRADLSAAGASSSTSRRWIGWLAATGIGALALLQAWPLIQLERATSSGLGAILSRGEPAADRDELREELRQMRSGRVLWVDDAPAGNLREIGTLEQAGLVVDVVTSNAAAAERMQGREYDVIISDIGRPLPEPARAGLDLPRVIVPDRNRVPPLIYYARVVKQPRTDDGYPVTNKPSELIRLVSDVFRWRQSSPTIRPLQRQAMTVPAPAVALEVAP
jgi:DNA-binding winged helix-turn-helix (wHTH) protein/CheY-like chemotaxis protein